MSRAGGEMWRVIDQPLTLKGTDARDILHVRCGESQVSECSRREGVTASMPTARLLELDREVQMMWT